MNSENNFQTPFKQDQYLGFDSESMEKCLGDTLKKYKRIPVITDGIMKTPEKKSILLKCVCSCNAIDVTKWEDEEEYHITFYESFNSGCHSFFARIKNAYIALLGKNKSNHGMVLSTEDFNKLKQL